MMLIIGRILIGLIGLAILVFAGYSGCKMNFLIGMPHALMTISGAGLTLFAIFSASISVGGVSLSVDKNERTVEALMTIIKTSGSPQQVALAEVLTRPSSKRDGWVDAPSVTMPVTVPTMSPEPTGGADVASPPAAKGAAPRRHGTHHSASDGPGAPTAPAAPTAPSAPGSSPAPVTVTETPSSSPLPATTERDAQEWSQTVNSLRDQKLIQTRMVDGRMQIRTMDPPMAVAK